MTRNRERSKTQDITLVWYAQVSQHKILFLFITHKYLYRQII